MSARTYKALVVDDEAPITHVVSLKLSRAGFVVVTAGDGEEAYEIATQDPPDIIITDLQMPYMDGLELCTRLKANPATSAIPALMLTARGFSLAPADLAKTNIKEVIAKPFGPKELLCKVQTLLGITPAAAELPANQQERDAA